MRLTEFRVRNFRSVNDSGWVEARQRTALVGRNESGKTNLLLALASLNRPGGHLPPLTFVKDFPRDRRREDFSEDLPVVDTVWRLSDRERVQLRQIFPRAKDVAQVSVGRPYAARRTVRFPDLPEISVDHEKLRTLLDKMYRSITASLTKKTTSQREVVSGAFQRLRAALTSTEAPATWASAGVEAITAFRRDLKDTSYALPTKAATILSEVRGWATDIIEDDEASAAARQWVEKNLPVFIYLDEYPELNGHQDVVAYLERRKKKDLESSDRYFEKLMKVADLDPDELQALLAGNHEQRQLLSNRASAVVTSQIRRLWTDRQLTMRFHLDERHFDTLISDPTSRYPVEVNLDERSKGFKWFFSFYITFAADTSGGPAERAILLLDEPGLHLHMLAQQDLLDHFKEDFDNTILYTTHSAFMIPVDDIASIRTVNIGVEEGTTVTNDPTGDELTLSPIQAALGYDLTQTLFIAKDNLVVEGVTDFWYLNSVSEHLASEGGDGLARGLVITPAGGAQKVPYMVALQTAHRLRVLVLLDGESRARRTAREDLLKAKLIREEYVMFVTDALSSSSKEADIEDLLDPKVFHQLVLETYRKELRGQSLNLNNNMPRIVSRYERAFEAMGLTFHKTRPAKLFLRRMGEDPAKVLPSSSLDRFRTLFGIINEKLKKLASLGREPFE